MRASRSNPDIAGQSVSAVTHCTTSNIAQYYQPVRSTCPDPVLQVYRADQSFKYLAVYRETTAHEVVGLALQVLCRLSAVGRKDGFCEFFNASGSPSETL